MLYVFDSSFVGALIIPDEKSKETDKLYAKIQNDDTRYVPQLLYYEIANIFKNLIRRRRYTYDEVLTFVPPLASLHLTIDPEAGAALSERLLRIAQDYNLSSYNAAYLELAGRKKAILCTLDENLKKAAKKYGAAVLK
jgi:predicted nucleic acid-binding protein